MRLPTAAVCRRGQGSASGSIATAAIYMPSVATTSPLLHTAVMASTLITVATQAFGLWSARQVATRLGVSVDTVRRMTRKGELHPIRLGRTVRYRPEEIEAVIAAGAA